MKKKIKKTLGDIRNYIDYKSLDEIIQGCNELKEKHKEYSNFYVDIYAYGSYGGGTEIEITLYAERDETDEEYEYRTAKEEKKKELDKLNAEKSQKQIKENRYKKYLELKKEFEGEIK